jgi:hypothetical protein
MSQEDIEALMSGLDIASDGNSEQTEEAIEPAKVNTKEIEELLSQTEEIKDKDDTTKVQESIETSVANIPNEDNANKNNKINEIENLLNDIEINSPKELVSSSENVKKIQDDDKSDRTEDEIVKDWTSSKINEGVFPFPAESDTKVVTQLSQVANDSEEKVSQIFDVLSQAAKEYHVLLEINNNALRDKNRKNVKENQKLIIENCKKYNHPFIMGSDAHFTTDIANYDHCGPLVESMNVDNELIMNYYPDRLREFLRK